MVPGVVADLMACREPSDELGPPKLVRAHSGSSPRLHLRIEVGDERAPLLIRFLLQACHEGLVHPSLAVEMRADSHVQSGLYDRPPEWVVCVDRTGTDEQCRRHTKAIEDRLRTVHDARMAIIERYPHRIGRQRGLAL